jgi:hypothetical protein
VAGPAVDANAREATLGVGTGAAVLAHVRSQAALVHIAFTQFTSKGRRAGARVAVDVVHARCAVLAQVAWAVVDVLLAVLALETWREDTKFERLI